MASPREKALTQFPAMCITLVSVVQAIALEALSRGETGGCVRREHRVDVEGRHAF